MFKFKLLAFLLSYIFVCRKMTIAVIRPSRFLYANDAFYAYLDNFSNVKNCWVHPNYGYSLSDDKQLIDLNSTTPLVTENGLSILPFTRLVCGVHVNMSTTYLGSELYLEAEYENGERDGGSMKIRRLESSQTIVTEIKSDIGKAKISCSLHDGLNKICKIVEDNGKRWDLCELVTTIRTNRTFDFYVYKRGNIEESHEHIKVTVNKPLSATSAVLTDTATSVILRCYFHNSTVNIYQAELPYHRTDFYIKDEQCYKRFSTFDSNIEESKCAIEILKPLRANEMGLWRIVNYGSDSPAGCLFYVGQNKSEIIKRELELVKNKVINVYKPAQGVDSKLPDIVYVLPFAIKECLIRDPNNVVYFSDRSEWNQRSYGKCLFTNLPIIDGLWIFNAFGHDLESVLRAVEINVKSRDGEVLTKSVGAKRNHVAKFMCRSAFDEPITYCLFVDPHNRVELLGTRNKIKSERHVQYHGRGLTYGDCGMKINEVRRDDFGIWQCLFHVATNEKPTIFEMELIEILVDVEHK